MLAKLFGPQRPPKRWESQTGRLLVWIMPFLVGAVLGLVTIKLVYPGGRGPSLLLLMAVLDVGMLAVLCLKCPWVRQPAIALLFTAVAGYGALVCGLVLLVRLTLSVWLGTSGPILAAVGAVLFVAGGYYAQLFRRHRPRGAALDGTG